MNNLYIVVTGIVAIILFSLIVFVDLTEQQLIKSCFLAVICYTTIGIERIIQLIKNENTK